MPRTLVAVGTRSLGAVGDRKSSSWGTVRAAYSGRDTLAGRPRIPNASIRPSPAVPSGSRPGLWLVAGGPLVAAPRPDRAAISREGACNEIRRARFIYLS